MAILEVNSITKRYGDLEILNDFSLEVEKGEVLAILAHQVAGRVRFFAVLTVWSALAAAIFS